jgi:hypothetical protein
LKFNALKTKIHVLYTNTWKFISYLS